MSQITQWYAMRAAGVATLVLFTLTVALGLVNRSRIATDRWPRFIIDRVHRNASLLAVGFLCVHIFTAVTDRFITIPLLAVLIPFVHSYRPVWVGFGSLAFDLLLTIIVTSLVRARLGYRSWKAIHWLAYAAWPIALLHGIGNGTDHTTLWMLAIDLGCITLVLTALAVRVISVPRLETV